MLHCPAPTTQASELAGVCRRNRQTGVWLQTFCDSYGILVIYRSLQLFKINQRISLYRQVSHILREQTCLSDPKDYRRDWWLTRHWVSVREYHVRIGSPTERQRRRRHHPHPRHIRALTVHIPSITSTLRRLSRSIAAASQYFQTQARSAAAPAWATTASWTPTACDGITYRQARALLRSWLRSHHKAAGHC